MTNEEINRAMAEIAGNIVIDPRILWRPPDYCNDLNLVREVELGLVEEGLRDKYLIKLCNEACNEQEVGILILALADAKTRCLAIIKTKGLSG